MTENVHTVICVFIKMFHQLRIAILYQHPKEAAVPVWVVAVDVAQHVDGAQCWSFLLTYASESFTHALFKELLGIQSRQQVHGVNTGRNVLHEVVDQAFLLLLDLCTAVASDDFIQNRMSCLNTQSSSCSILQKQTQST